MLIRVFRTGPTATVALLMIGACIGAVSVSALFIVLGVLRVVL